MNFNVSFTIPLCRPRVFVCSGASHFQALESIALLVPEFFNSFHYSSPRGSGNVLFVTAKGSGDHEVHYYSYSDRHPNDYDLWVHVIFSVWPKLI